MREGQWGNAWGDGHRSSGDWLAPMFLNCDSLDRLRFWLSHFQDWKDARAQNGDASDSRMSGPDCGQNGPSSLDIESRGATPRVCRLRSGLAIFCVVDFSWPQPLADVISELHTSAFWLVVQFFWLLHRKKLSSWSKVSDYPPNHRTQAQARV